jgi:hypothetical protein
VRVRGPLDALFLVTLLLVTLFLVALFLVTLFLATLFLVTLLLATLTDMFVVIKYFEFRTPCLDISKVSLFQFEVPFLNGLVTWFAPVGNVKSTCGR